MDNLSEMSVLCRTLALDGKSPTAFFVLEKVLSRIADDWEDRPLTVEEAQYVESQLRPQVERVMDAITFGKPAQAQLDALDTLVSAYIILFTRPRPETQER